MHKLSLSTMIFSSFIFLFRRWNVWNSYFQSFHLHDQLPVGLQLKRYTGNAEVRVRIPASMNFSAFFFPATAAYIASLTAMVFSPFIFSILRLQNMKFIYSSFHLLLFDWTLYAFYLQILKYKLTWIGSLNTLTSTLRWVTQSVHSQDLRPWNE